MCLGADQFVAGYAVDNINNLCFVYTALQALGEVAHIQAQGTAPRVASWQADHVYVAEAKLSVGGMVSQVMLLLLVVGLPLAPSLAALVPFVLIDVQGSALAGKSVMTL